MAENDKTALSIPRPDGLRPEQGNRNNEAALSPAGVHGRQLGQEKYVRPELVRQVDGSIFRNLKEQVEETSDAFRAAGLCQYSQRGELSREGKAIAGLSLTAYGLALLHDRDLRFNSLDEKEGDRTPYLGGNQKPPKDVWRLEAVEPVDGRIPPNLEIKHMEVQRIYENAMTVRNVLEKHPELPGLQAVDAFINLLAATPALPAASAQDGEPIVRIGGVEVLSSPRKLPERAGDWGAQASKPKFPGGDRSQ